MTNGDLVKGAAGSVATISAAAVSCLPALETGLRLASIIVGLSIGLITLVGMWKKQTKKTE